MMRVSTISLTCLTIGFALGTLVGCGKSSSGNIADSEHAMEIRATLLGGGGGDTPEVDPDLKPTGWAKLTGTITVDGTPPGNPQLTISGADTAICKPGGQPVYDRKIAMGASGGLSDVLIFVRKLPDDWLHEDAKDVPVEPLVFDQHNCVFDTRLMAVNANRSIIVKNSDPVGHNTNIAGFANFNVNKNGGEVPFSFKGKAKSQPITVKCNVHPWMKAYMIPLANNYFDVTGEDGKFTIDNLPAGVPLEFQVWQETAGGLSNVEITNLNVEWGKRGRFVVTLRPGEDEVLDIKIPADTLKP